MSKQLQHQTSFKYIDRKRQKTILLIPGWAADYRIFGVLDLDFNYLAALEAHPASFIQNLLREIENRGIKSLSIFGWSLGGFLASEFASRYSWLVDDLILVSVREKYNKVEVNTIKALLEKNKRGCLRKFYSQCLNGEDERKWFKSNLLKSYCDGFSLDSLYSTLDYLGDAEIGAGQLSGIKNVRVIHGEFDKIAPIHEAENVARRIQGARFIRIKNAGHIPFLNKRFNQYI